MRAMYRKLDQARNLPPLALAMGVFDGVHRGHQALLTLAQKEAARLRGEGVIPAALTFDPHPAVVLSPARAPLLLGTLEERAALLHQYGAGEVLVVPFDRDFAALTPDEFIRETLINSLHARVIIVGEDFRFGCDRTGDAAYLHKAGERYGFTVNAVPPVFVQGVPARSTAIRQMLSGGEADEAARLLGRLYSLAGPIVHGRKLGRTLGFPTANVEIDPLLLVPADGVYAGYALLETGERRRTAISIGTNPTVTPERASRSVEAFLMDDFKGDLYGQIMRLEFVRRLRPTLKFEGLDSLIIQMRRDVAEAAERLSLSGTNVKP